MLSGYGLWQCSSQSGVTNTAQTVYAGGVWNQADRYLTGDIVEMVDCPLHIQYIAVMIEGSRNS